MDNEAEVTLEQMEETRGALSEKLETLGQQVVDTVQGATTAVAETVENVKDAVHDTVETVKDTFDLHLQVKRHPWGMLGGALALGWLGGYLLLRHRSDRPGANAQSELASRASPQFATQGNGVAQAPRFAQEAPAKMPVQNGTPSASEGGWLSGVNRRFGEEITKVKGLAIGTVLSGVRDLFIPSLPDHLKPGLAGVMDSITVKLGGEPVPGRLLKVPTVG
jgi:hypothetical protein